MVITMEKTIQEIMHEQMLSIQESDHLTNQAMAHALVMDPRTYFDHTKGFKDCGFLTTILLILHSPDSDVLLEEMRMRLTKCMEETGKEETLVV